MPWAASQVAWAGPGVLDFLVVPASRRRREAGRHRGLRGPKAMADQVVVCGRFPEGVRPPGAGRPRARPGPRRAGRGWRRLPCGWRSSGRPRRASTGEASRSARCGGAGRTIRRPGASRPCVTVAETGHHRVRRRRRGTAGVVAARSVAASTVTGTSNIHQRTERAGGCPNSGIAFTASIVSPDQASARRSRQAAKPISTAA